MKRTLISLASMLVLLSIPLSAFSQNAPTINKVDPNETASEQTVTIMGSNFIPTPSMNQVLIGGKAATVNSCDQTSMSVTLPANLAAGDTTVSVTAHGQKSNDYKIKILPPPELSSLSLPPDVSQTIQAGKSLESAPPGFNIIITGNNFGKDPGKIKVYFDDVQAQMVSATQNRIECIIPDVHSPQLYVQISVKNGPVKSKNTLGIAVQTRVF